MLKLQTIKELPESERPYEKCEMYGSQYLSEAELLAVIIRTGTRNLKSIELAQEILKLAYDKGGLYYLNHLTPNELQSIKGVGRVKAIQIQCMLEMTRRMAKARFKTDLKWTNPEEIAAYYMEDMRYHTQEHLILVMLNAKHQRIKDVVISKGLVDSSMIRPREIYIEAMRYEAVKIILIHNHPSGDPTPSNDDISVSKRVKQVGELMGISLLDHIIIGDHTFVSLHERKLI